MPLKLGLRPLEADSRDLKLRDYLKLPRVPQHFGHESLVPSWGMLGNDEWGDCAWAGSAHETMLWTAAAGAPVQFTTESVLSDYAACTGFDEQAGAPGKNPTDQGTDIRNQAIYRRDTGILDAAGHRHKIGAFLFLEPGNITELMIALYLFETVGVGLVMQEAQMEQFNAGKVWEYVPGSPDVGGHYVPAVQRKNRTTLDFLSWGRPVAALTHFYRERSDQAVACVSPDALSGADQKTAEGLNLAQLNDDLAQLHGEH